MASPPLRVTLRLVAVTVLRKGDPSWLDIEAAKRSTSAPSPRAVRRRRPAPPRPPLSRLAAPGSRGVQGHPSGAGASNRYIQAGPHKPAADREHVGNLPVCVALGHEPYDLSLPRRQADSGRIIAHARLLPLHLPQHP